MRRKRIWIALVLAAVSGVAAGYLALNFFERAAIIPSSAVASTTPVAIAARDLPVGTVLAKEDIDLVDWPSGSIPQGYARSAEEVLGHGVITPVSAQEPLLLTKLASKEAGGGLPIVIPEGMRAVSVKVDQVISVAGFVVPQTRVDVLVTLTPADDRSEITTKVILQNVRVLTAGQTMERDAEGKPQTVTVITLLVTPQEAERLTLAATEGRIQLALRNTMDNEEVKTEGVQKDNLVQRAEAPRPSAPRVRRPSQPRTQYGVEVYNGTDRSVATF
ncbi:MAG TPA: Flp pilus assembly protein CpaB [Gemmatimonadota bacterium]|nr:Flp pilus assembly protein CpaB [Gemmatimonadota bacterium]